VTEGSDPTDEIGTPTTEVGTHASTVVLAPAEDRSPRPKIIALTFLAVAAGAFLIGIVVASTIRESPPGTLLASEQVGPSGGAVRFSGGEIRVPPGALGSPKRLVVRRTVVAERIQVRLPGRPVQVFDPGELVAYIFEPRELEFLRPVTIVFRLRSEAGDATAFARVGTATLLLSGGIDTTRGIVAVEVSDFSFDSGQPVGAGR
jgi:hypothetical protein